MLADIACKGEGEGSLADKKKALATFSHIHKRSHTYPSLLTDTLIGITLYILWDSVLFGKFEFWYENDDDGLEKSVLDVL